MVHRGSVVIFSVCAALLVRLDLYLLLGRESVLGDGSGAGAGALSAGEGAVSGREIPEVLSFRL